MQCVHIHGVCFVLCDNRQDFRISVEKYVFQEKVTQFISKEILIGISFGANDLGLKFFCIILKCIFLKYD